MPSSVPGLINVNYYLVSTVVFVCLFPFCHTTSRKESHTMACFIFLFGSIVLDSFLLR